MTTTLAEFLEHAEVGQDVPTNWAQGRTAFGGFTSALLLRAALGTSADLPALRSAMINFTAPVTETPDMAIDVLRQGRNVTTLDVKARVAGKVVACGVFSFGASQISHVSDGLPAASVPVPEEAELMIPEGREAPAAFFNNFEVRLIEGNRPFAGAARGHVRIWARHRDRASWSTPEGLMCLGDVLPPAIFVKATKPGPNSSMNWMYNVVREDTSTRDGWYMLETDLSAAENGYSSQVMRIWNSDGDLLVDGMQAVVTFV
ncbi:acyl-CoA thioesterase [Shimia haliotis]|uniref:Acyl-CoA thioesterase n=1 Tax=Shimia haliotis TaxID=1280847 RepID=A0A1I4AM46_9RHOB|nr:thioesterase family protein [Shimia haliotis]SFK57592.1 Acyl-CoA thioesterase [Shimia haliotis]